MIVHVARRGHSFKGAGLYYLHDKGASTTERVEWTHTHNLPTDDPDKALKWMAYTTQSSDRLKAEAGVAMTGRKASAGCVYAFALSWHPEQKPEKEHMLNAAFTTLERLGLKEHEAVMVAHQDTDHPHVHVICNLINPKDGRTAVPSYDRLSLSKWAEEYEKEDGKIYCEERVKNNEQRREKAKEDRQLAIVKHREEKLDCAAQVQELYNQSDSGKGFQAALNEAGFTLAQGDRRGFVIVDAYGKIHSLSRQLKGQRAQDIKARLSDIDHALLPQAKTVSEERQYFDRDKYEAEWQMKTVDAAIDGESSKEVVKSEQAKIDSKSAYKVTSVFKDDETSAPYDDSHLVRLDKQRELEQKADRERHLRMQELKAYYDPTREKLKKEIHETKKHINSKVRFFHKITGKDKELKGKLEELNQSLGNLELRHNEKIEADEKKIQQLFDSTKSDDFEKERQRQRERSVYHIPFKSREEIRNKDNDPSKQI